ncbi:MAG TPA: hypothetical protein V6D17_04935 [Candidatus Obscuribacterales bacterium]
MTHAKTIVRDLGEILSLELPPGWEESERQEPAGGRLLRKFHDPDRQEIRFCSYERTGIELSRPGSELFERTLYGQFHELSQDEFLSLAELIEGMSNQSAFSLSRAFTTYLNDRRLLKVEGDWPRLDESTICCFLDVGGKARMCQLIYFTAPRSYLSTGEGKAVADEIFMSIKWRRT